MELRNEDGLYYNEFIEAYHKIRHTFPKAALTADVMFFHIKDDEIELLMIKRKNHPYIGSWALPGGFFDPNEDESLEACASRELLEETGVQSLYLDCIGQWSHKERDDRDRIVTAAFISVIPQDIYSHLKVQAADDADDALWFKLNWSNLSSHVEKRTAFDVIRTSQIQIELKSSTEQAFQTIELIEERSRLKSSRKLAVHNQGNIAFDHGEMIFTALLHLKKGWIDEGLVYHSLPESFDINTFQTQLRIFVQNEDFVLRAIDKSIEMNHIVEVSKGLWSFNPEAFLKPL